MQSRPYIVGVAGGSGSGKTFFLSGLLEHFATDEITLISQDDYYLPAQTQTDEENRLYNFDLPTAIDRKQFCLDIGKLLNGETLTKRSYTFNNPHAAQELLVLRPAPIIVIEGLFVFYYSELNSLLDRRIFLHADEEIALARRLERDRVERGYAADDVKYKWYNHVIPAYKKYLMPYQEMCDQLIVNNGKDPFALAELTRILAEDLRSKLL